MVRFRRSTRVLTSWLAVAALLMAALAPSISHAFAAGRVAPWTEVCTSAGAKAVLPNGMAGDEVPAPAVAHLFEHCPYCSLHADAAAVPPAPAAVVPAVLPGHELPAAFLAAPRTPHAWVTAQPRAPPLFS